MKRSKSLKKLVKEFLDNLEYRNFNDSQEIAIFKNKNFLFTKFNLWLIDNNEKKCTLPEWSISIKSLADQYEINSVLIKHDQK